MIFTGCLITDPPQFNPPRHTRPFLIEATADPDPKSILTVDTQLLPTTQSAEEFSAEVVSQDDPSSTTMSTDFQQVTGWLYIDLGFDQGDGKQPYRLAFPGSSIPAGGTLEQTGRRIRATWRPGSQIVDPGCHTATLIVSHRFDDIPCPVCDDDFSSITWQILRCDRSADGCKELPVHGDHSCEGLTNSCAVVRAKLGAAALTCSEHADAGAP